MLQIYNPAGPCLEHKAQVQEESLCALGHQSPAAKGSERYSEGKVTSVFYPSPLFNHPLVYFIYLNSTLPHTQLDFCCVVAPATHMEENFKL